MSGTAEAIALALVARLAAIDGTGTFETTIGDTVFRGRRRIDETAIPCITLIESDEKVLQTAQDNKLVRLSQRYIVEAHDACDADNPNDKAHALIRDIKRALFLVDKTLGGVARTMTYAGRMIAARDDGMAIVSAVVEIDVEYAENLTAP